MVDCKKCKKRFRADHLVESLKKEEGATSYTPQELNELEKALANAVCTECGGELTAIRQFNLMFKTHMGPVEDSAAAYTCAPRPPRESL